MFGSWSIYTVGDVGFFEQVLIGVAMVTGTNDFARAAGIGLLFSLLMVFFQSLSKGLRELNYQQALIGWIVYMCMFVPSTTVILEDGVTGEVRVVANVPLGVGAAGGMISSIGHGITELFEQGYAFTAGSDMQNRQFAEPLYVMNQIHRATSNPVLLAELSESIGTHANLKQSWENYIRECTLRKVQLNIASMESIQREPVRQSLKFDSPTYHTRIYDGAVGGRNMRCGEAYDTLLSLQDSAWHNVTVQQKLGYLMGIDNPKNPTYEDVTSTINDAIQMVGLVNTSAIPYLNTTLLQPIFNQAIQGKYNNENDIGNALMVNQATAQRNVQWMAEKTMFATTIRPLQTFFEGFIYAVAPIIGILLATGTFGISLAFKYLVTLLWIQLWKPILSIANLYIITAASGALSAFDDENLNSFYSIDTMYQSISHWMGVGGMMAAATPMLALMLVTGSTYAMTNIAGRISGGDHINEKMRSPDALKDAPVVSGVALAKSDHLTGTASVHAPQSLGTFEIGSALSNAVGSADVKAQDASQSFQKSLQRAAESTGSATQSAGFKREIGEMVMTGNSRQADMARALHQKLVQDHNLDAATASQVVGTFAMGGNASVGIPGAVSASGGVKGSTTSNTSATFGTSARTVDGLARDVGWTEKDSQSMTEQLASRISGNDSFVASHSLSDKAAKSLQESASEVISTSKSYRQATELAQRFGASDSVNIHDVAGRLGDSGYINSSPAVKSAYEDLNEFFRMQASPQMRQEAQQLASMYQHDSGYRMDPMRALMAGRLKAMSRPENYAAGEEDSGLLALASIVSRVQTGQDVGMRDGALGLHGHSNLAMPGFAVGSVMGEVQAGVIPAHGLDIGAAQSHIGGAYQGASSYYEGVRNDPATHQNHDYVADVNEAQRERFTDTAISARADAARQSRESLELTMANVPVDIPVGMYALDAGNNIGRLVSSGLLAPAVASNIQNVVAGGDSNAYRDHAPQIFNEISNGFRTGHGLHEDQANYIAAKTLGMGAEANAYAERLSELHGAATPQILERLDAAALSTDSSKAYLGQVQHWNELHAIETSGPSWEDGVTVRPSITGTLEQQSSFSEFDRAGGPRAGVLNADTDVRSRLDAVETSVAHRGLGGHDAPPVADPNAGETIFSQSNQAPAPRPFVDHGARQRGGGNDQGNAKPVTKRKPYAESFN